MYLLSRLLGSGPHSFDETGLDVYVLPHSNVTLQATPYQRATRVIDWSSTLKKSWITNKIAQRGTKLIVGPMDKALNLLSLRYYIQRGGSNSESIELFSSNTVTLYLAGKKSIVTRRRASQRISSLQQQI